MKNRNELKAIANDRNQIHSRLRFAQDRYGVIAGNPFLPQAEKDMAKKDMEYWSARHQETFDADYRPSLFGIDTDYDQYTLYRAEPELYAN